MKRILKIFIILISVVVILSVSVVVITYVLNMPTGNIAANGTEIEIRNGDNPHKIANRLYIDGAIKSKRLFVIINRVFGFDSKIKSGYFMITKNMTTFDIAKHFVYGQPITVSFTVPEGSTVNQIKAILIDRNIVKAKEIDDFFAKSDYLSVLGLGDFPSLEGFLFPETYKIDKGSTIEEVLKIMIAMFYKKISLVEPNYREIDSKEFYKKIVMASIIEKEVRNQDESKIVAGVFYNRLKKRMKLESCATIQYILGKPKERLFESDLLVEHPFNTYLNYGLPPHAIANPGFNALEAAFHPLDHKYIFFVVKDPINGTHYFSETYQEHLFAQAVYKDIKGFR